MFAALICLLLSEKHSTSTEKQELVFLNTVLPEKKHEGCSNNSRRARRGSNNGPAKEGGKRENKAAGAHAAACVLVLVLTAEAGISFGCSEHQEQMQQQQSRSPMA